jgi:hypothetical protein
LKDEDFVDEYGNLFKNDMKAIKVISEALKKTDLKLSIRSGVNMFDENMDNNSMVTSNDPLDQAYVDPEIYQDVVTPLKCDVVIKSIPETFRGRVFQSQGVFWVTRMSDAVGTFTYRQFDYNGDYESDSSISPVIELEPP